jgi:hypothetical protein
MGEHKICDGMRPNHLYMPLTLDVVQRAAFLGPVRSDVQVSFIKEDQL